MVTKTIYHTRSNSFPLPSRQYPLATEVNEHLNRLTASDATSTSSSSSSSSISHKPNGLQDLYDCVDKLLQFPYSQQALAQQQQDWVNELLDGSLRLLELCSTAKDVQLQTKESAKEIQSLLCRRRSGEFELVNEVRKYFTSRKIVQKSIHKALRNLKSFETKCIFSSSDDHEIKAMVSLLKEVEALTSLTFEYSLSLISGPKEQSNPGIWLLVSKPLNHKRIECEEAGRRDISEFEKVDAALRSILNKKMSKSENSMNVEMQNQLKDLELVFTILKMDFSASSGV